ncbi:ent-kaurene oxidase [Xylariaceae sp. FL0016]|nr:ent-kaurene oxidase [Xylariaceae sp. FL0016]
MFAPYPQALALGILSVSVVLYCLTKALSGDAITRMKPTQPTVGLRKEWISYPRSCLRSVFRTRDWAFEAYQKYSKVNAFCVLPSIDRGRLLVVPPRQIRKVYGLPVESLDVHKTANRTIQTDWTIWDKEVSDNDFQMNLIRNQLTRNLDVLTPGIAQELENGFRHEWGESMEDWKTIDLWASVMRIIGGAANSAFCGKPLCRDADFINRIHSHSMWIFLGSLLINCTPKPLRPLTGGIVGWACYFCLKRVSKLGLPLVKERLHHTALLKEDPSYTWVPPQDGLQWMIDECYATGDPAQLNPDRILHRLVFINDISLHSTSYTTMNVILELASADPSLGYIEALREESARVLKEAGGKWTRKAVTKLNLVDSTIRESMRLTPFNSVGLPRTVVNPHGTVVDNGSSSLRVPCGASVVIPVQPIHYDNELYPRATTFDPFRFARPTSFSNILDSIDATSPSPGTGEKARDSGEDKVKSSATVDDAFLGFGFGKHACPGRFFALNEVKIFVAQMVLNYNIEHLERGKPEMTPVIWLNMPLFTNLGVRVRRRNPVELSREDDN